MRYPSRPSPRDQFVKGMKKEDTVEGLGSQNRVEHVTVDSLYS